MTQAQFLIIIGFLAMIRGDQLKRNGEAMMANLYSIGCLMCFAGSVAFGWAAR